MQTRTPRSSTISQVCGTWHLHLESPCISVHANLHVWNPIWYNLYATCSVPTYATKDTVTYSQARIIFSHWEAKRSSYPARLHQPKPYSRRFPASMHLPLPSLGLNFFSALYWEQHAWNEQRTYWLSPLWQKFITESSYSSDLELFEELKLEQTHTVWNLALARENLYL